MNWQQAIEAELGRATEHVVARTFRKCWQTASKPVLLACDDGQEYVVKGRQAGRQIVNDRVVGLCGAYLDAPIPTLRLVYVPDSLIQIEPALHHMPAGLCHGSVWLPGHSERESLMHTDEETNLERFARLAVLYGWIQAGDHQFIYSNAPPYPVSSVDHGHFFPDGPDWTVQSLMAASPPELDPIICNGMTAFDSYDFADIGRRLGAVSDADVVRLAASSPKGWGLALDERVALAKYLSGRRDSLADKLVQS